MITLEDVITEASCAEGAQMAQIVTAKGDFNKQKLNSIIPLVNSALDEIYKRFIVSNTYIPLTTQQGVRDYLIAPEYNTTNSNDPYIMDPDFNSPVIAITSLADELGNAIPLNGATKETGLKPTFDSVQYASRSRSYVERYTTPKYNVLRVPTDLPPTNLVVGLRVAHPRIPLVPAEELTTVDLGEITIDLPVSYRTAIVYYIFYRLMNAKGASAIGRSMYHEGDGYFSKFLKECDALRQSDSEVTEQIDYANCYKRTGFV